MLTLTWSIPGQLDRLEERVKAAAPECGAGSICAVECAWGKDGWQKSPLKDEKEGWDTIILSELVYEEDAHDALLYTLQKLASPKTVVYSIFCDRPWSFMFFVKVHDAGGFKVEAIPDEQVRHHDLDTSNFGSTGSTLLSQQVSCQFFPLSLSLSLSLFLSISALPLSLSLSLSLPPPIFSFPLDQTDSIGNAPLHKPTDSPSFLTSFFGCRLTF
jgi:hypothetical protein